MDEKNPGYRIIECCTNCKHVYWVCMETHELGCIYTVANTDPDGHCFNWEEDE